MFAGVLALLTRALRAEARSRQLNVVRFAFVLCIFGNLLLAEATSRFRGAPGLQFFSGAAYLNLWLILLAGVSYFATAITEEKEEETLGLLKMAGISRLGILLGKSTSRLVSAALLLIVQFPFTLLAITLGGITARQVCAVYLALLAFLVLVANIGLFCSVCCRRSRGAATLTIVLLALYFWLPALVAAILAPYSASPIAARILPWIQWLGQINIFFRLKEAMTTGFGEPIVGAQVFSNLGAAAGFFLLSWATFDWFTRDLGPVTPSRGLVGRRFGAKRRWAAGRVWQRALVWKDFHFVAGGMPTAVIKFVVYLALTIPGYGMFWTAWSDRLMICMLVAAVIEAALLASRVFQEEVKAKTLPALMTLPVPLVRIILSKVAGCSLALAPAVSLFTLGWALHGFKDAGTMLQESGFWFGLLYYLVFLHLVACLSLFVKWGALPLAFVFMWFGQSCVMMPLAMLGIWGPGTNWLLLLVLADFGCIALIFLLQAIILGRLQLLAAE